MRTSMPNRLSPSGRNEIVDPIILGCPDLIAVSVQKVARRGKQATESDELRKAHVAFTRALICALRNINLEAKVVHGCVIRMTFVFITERNHEIKAE